MPYEKIFPFLIFAWYVFASVPVLSRALYILNMLILLNCRHISLFYLVQDEEFQKSDSPTRHALFALVILYPLWQSLISILRESWVTCDEFPVTCMGNPHYRYIIQNEALNMLSSALYYKYWRGGPVHSFSCRVICHTVWTDLSVWRVL